MSVMDRLFPGRKVRTPDTIAAALFAARDAMMDAQARVTTASDHRAAAIAAGDRSAAISAKADSDAAEVDVEIAAEEIAGLEKGLADAVRAAEEAARAALIASLVERRHVLGARFEAEWRDAAAVLGKLLSEGKTLQRDIAEARADHEVERLPDMPRGLPMRDEAVGNVSRWLDDALSKAPAVLESPNERDFREHQARRERERAEVAEARRVKA